MIIHPKFLVAFFSSRFTFTTFKNGKTGKRYTKCQAQSLAMGLPIVNFATTFPRKTSLSRTEDLRANDEVDSGKGVHPGWGWWHHRFSPPCWSPLKGDIPNKYTLYKVYKWGWLRAPSQGYHHFPYDDRTSLQKDCYYHPHYVTYTQVRAVCSVSGRVYEIVLV